MRPGHHRPLGTTTTMRFPDWPRDARPPELGDVTCQTDGPRGRPASLRPVDAEREKEVRDLAARFAEPDSGHRRVGAVLADLLDELDDARADADEWADRYWSLLADTGGVSSPPAPSR